MERFIIVLVVVIAIIAISQLLRVYQLASQLKGHREEDISKKDNQMNATLWLVFMVSFYIFFIWLYYEYGGNRFGKGQAASDIGEKTDWLLNLNMIIITIVFFITNSILFIFAWKYAYDKNRKAYFYPHNNKLELLWTVVPSIVLAIIIILGLKTWFEVTDNSSSGDPTIAGASQNIEVYSRQFDWHVRYAGEDNQLGQSDYKLVTGTNPVGVITSGLIDSTSNEMTNLIHALENQLKTEGSYIPNWKYEELKSKIIRTKRLQRRLNALKHNIIYDIENENDPKNWNEIAHNDIVVLGEMYLVKGTKYNFVFRSQDVIHSAYFPHFRAQMNTVPGEPTFISFTPTMTTEEKRKEMNDPNFDFVLVCNKICGKSHSQMKMKVIVGDADGFRQWLDGKTRIDGQGLSYVPFKEGDILFPKVVTTADESTETPDLDVNVNISDTIPEVIH